MLADAPAAVVHRAAAQAVGIGEREYQIAVYRPRVKPGALKLNVRNLGEDDHDLVIRRHGRRVGALHGVVRPGATATLRLTLRHPGQYDLVCTVADHESRGMRAALRVVAR
jgi:hypothetical protein